MSLTDQVLTDWWNETHPGKDRPKRLTDKHWKSIYKYIAQNPTKYMMSVRGLNKTINEDKLWKKAK